MDEVETRRVPTAGPTISVRDRAGGEPAILALHGLASNARWWDLVGRDLAPAHRVLAADLRGHGESDRPETGYDFATVVGDLRQVVEVLSPRPLLVAGHSWGASVALAFAAALPELALGAVCVDGGATDLKAYFGPTWEVAEQTMRPPNLAGIPPDAMRKWMESSPMSEGSNAETASEILRGNFEVDGGGQLRPHLHVEQHMQIARHLFELDSYELMARVRCPVLFIPAGTPDHEDTPKVRAMEHAQAVLGDRARIVWIDGIHDLPVQRPHEVASAIAEFIAELQPT